jgi:phytoene dehydrogenase-like protein
MTIEAKYDAVVVGSGPNGLAAAMALAQKKLSVLLVEAKASVGGGMRSAELTLPGFIHDVCSAIHPLAAGSPFLKMLPLQQYGLKWIFPPAALAHPFDDGSAVLLTDSIEETAAMLGEDANHYSKIFRPLCKQWDKIAPEILGPLRIPRHPFLVLGFTLYAMHSAIGFVERNFTGNRAKSFFCGMAAHSMLPLDKTISAAAGLVLNILGHTTGWPLAGGGSQKIADAMAAYFQELNGGIVLNTPVADLEQLPPAKAVLLDLTPKQILDIVKNKFPAGYRRQLDKYRYGPGVFKIDWALSDPVPFKAPGCSRAATVHIGGGYGEIMESEGRVWQGKVPEKPFVIMVQPSLFDAGRAPEGRHTAWAYCHTPPGWDGDLTESVENQIERFAPGFRDCIFARHILTAREMERYNANYVGGDINGGMQDLRQLFTRPALRLDPYTTPAADIFLCSSSTPPGGGVHGMCGFHAAQTVLTRMSTL